MEKQKNDKKQTRKSRAKVKTPTDFFKITKQTLLSNYDHEQQNEIVKELCCAVRMDRNKEIEQLRIEVEKLTKLNQDLPEMG